MSRTGDDKQRVRHRMLDAYEHTGRRLLILGLGLLGVLGTAVVVAAFYGLRYRSDRTVLAAAGPISIAGLFFGLSASLKQVARILEARNHNPAMASTAG